MELIASSIAVIGLFAAFIFRAIEANREERKRERMFQRNNKKPWQRSDSIHK